jgi:flagellar basal-body rod protein FlgG
MMDKRGLQLIPMRNCVPDWMGFLGALLVLTSCQHPRLASTSDPLPTRGQVGCCQNPGEHDAFMQAYLLALETIAKNLANIDTPGFQRVQPHFQEWVGAAGESALIPGPSLKPESGEEAVGADSKLSLILRGPTTGKLVQTGERMDLAIQGDGFFEVALPDGALAYTRDGAFRLAADGRFTTRDSFPLRSGFQPIPQPTINLTITPQGVVRGATAEAQHSFQLQLCKFNRPAELQAIGRNLYRETIASGPPQTENPGQNGVGEVLQGYLELSTVNVAEEVRDLVRLQRSYLAYLRSKELKRAVNRSQHMNHPA